MKFYFGLIVILVLILTPLGFVSAHSTGPSVHKSVGNYLIDIGYSPEEIIEEIPVTLNFLLEDLSTSTHLPFDNVWVRIEKDGKTFLATSVNGGADPVLTYSFSEAGEYVLYVRYEVQGENVVEAELPLNVAVGEKTSMEGINKSGGVPFLTGGLIAGILVGGFAVSYIKSKQRQNRK